MSRNTGLMIDTLYQQLLTLSRNPRYGLDSLRSEWGRTNGELYNSKKLSFCRGIRELAKDCPVKWHNGSFYLFNGVIYERCDDDVVKQAYRLLLEGLALARMVDNVTVMRDVFLATIKLYNVLSPQFDVVAFKNGVVDFGTNRTDPQVMPFGPEWHVIYYHPYDFDPKAKCLRWQSFLHEMLPDKTSRLILQMFLGLGLVQRGDAYNKYDGKTTSKIELCLILLGTGKNGKSVVYEVMSALFGKERISSMDYGALTAQGDEGMRGRFPIRNAIFNWSMDSDAKKFGRGDNGMFKRLVSGEPVPMRELGKNILETRRLPYMIFNMNELPFSEDASFGFIRRLQFVSFNVVVPKEKEDKALSSKIVSSELSGVFNWVLRGAQELRKRRFVFPESDLNDRQKLLSLMSSQPITAWVAAYGMRPGKEAQNEIGVEIPASKMYTSFTTFCRDNDVDERDIPSIQRFGRLMRDKERFFKRKTPSGMVYKVYGATEDRIMEQVLLSELPVKKEDSESFIRDDD